MHNMDIGHEIAISIDLFWKVINQKFVNIFGFCYVKIVFVLGLGSNVIYLTTTDIWFSFFFLLFSFVLHWFLFICP